MKQMLRYDLLHNHGACSMDGVILVGVLRREKEKWKSETIISWEASTLLLQNTNKTKHT